MSTQQIFAAKDLLSIMRDPEDDSQVLAEPPPKRVADASTSNDAKRSRITPSDSKYFDR